MGINPLSRLHGKSPLHIRLPRLHDHNMFSATRHEKRRQVPILPTSQPTHMGLTTIKREPPQQPASFDRPSLYMDVVGWHKGAVHGVVKQAVRDDGEVQPWRWHDMVTRGSLCQVRWETSTFHWRHQTFHRSLGGLLSKVNRRVYNLFQIKWACVDSSAYSQSRPPTKCRMLIATATLATRIPGTNLPLTLTPPNAYMLDRSLNVSHSHSPHHPTDHLI